LRNALALAKPRITLLVALCAAAGFVLAGGGDRARLFWTLIGVALASASTGCLNQLLEADFDAMMNRTKARPLPSGSIGQPVALALGLAWGVAGLGVLAWKTNLAATILTGLTLSSYLIVYTPMKRISPLSTWFGAIPGALPPVIGWAAAGGALDAGAASLFAIQFLWQMPHFLALAWLHREDYARGGFRIYPVIDPSGASTAWQMAATSGLLLAVSLIPFGLGMAGYVYLAGALACGGVFLVLSFAAARDLSNRTAKRVFFASLAYLPLVLALLVADRR
jgi:heme o synthase